MAGRDSHQGNSCPHCIVMPLLSAQEQRGVGRVEHKRALTFSHVTGAEWLGGGRGNPNATRGLYCPAYQPPTVA